MWHHPELLFVSVCTHLRLHFSRCGEIRNAGGVHRPRAGVGKLCLRYARSAHSHETRLHARLYDALNTLGVLGFLVMFNPEW